MFKWKDNKYVHILSAIYDNKIRVNQRAKDSTLNKVLGPKVLYNYNKNMSFVDNFNCLAKDYELDRKSTK